MFISYGHIKKTKENHRFFYDFRSGHVPLTIFTFYAFIYIIDHKNVGIDGI